MYELSSLTGRLQVARRKSGRLHCGSMCICLANANASMRPLLLPHHLPAVCDTQGSTEAASYMSKGYHEEPPMFAGWLSTISLAYSYPLFPLLFFASLCVPANKQCSTNYNMVAARANAHPPGARHHGEDVVWQHCYAFLPWAALVVICT